MLNVNGRNLADLLTHWVRGTMLSDYELLQLKNGLELVRDFHYKETPLHFYYATQFNAVDSVLTARKQAKKGMVVAKQTDLRFS